MILYYALGGGLGHITRALAVLHTLRVREKVVIVSSMNPSVLDFIPANIQIVQPPVSTYRDINKLTAYIQYLIEEYRPSEFMVDGFPLGAFGELKNIVYSGMRTYLARLLKWDHYTKISGNRFFIFNQTFILEPLHEDHRFIIDRISETFSSLEIRDPPHIKPLPAIADLDQHWLVLHSGPDDEVDDLIIHAKQIREIEQKRNPFLLVTPSAINKWTHQPVTHIRFYPALLLMPHVEKIVSACGFNTMRQAKPYRNKHHFFPFARHFDDQYFRAALYRHSAPAGRRTNNARNNMLRAFSEDSLA